jgi:hypothetical protein
MPHDLIALLIRARTVLERYMFEADGAAIRDDVAEICMAIDDELPDEGVRRKEAEFDRSLLERSAVEWPMHDATPTESRVARPLEKAGAA